MSARITVNLEGKKCNVCQGWLGRMGTPVKVHTTDGNGQPITVRIRLCDKCWRFALVNVRVLPGRIIDGKSWDYIGQMRKSGMRDTGKIEEPYSGNPVPEPLTPNPDDRGEI